MRSIQTNPMIFMSDQLSVAFSFSRRAHLLTTCKAGGGIPPVGQARALFTNCLRTVLQRGQAMPQAASPVQSALCFASSSKQLFPFWKQPAACLRKPATGSFYAVMGIASSATPIFFLRKRNKNKSDRTVRTNGDLPLGSESCEPWNRTKCGGCFRLSELLQHSE